MLQSSVLLQGFQLFYRILQLTRLLSLSAGPLRGGNDLSLGPGGSPVRFGSLASCCPDADRAMAGPGSCDSIYRNPFANPGCSLSRVAWEVLLDAVCRVIAFRFLETLFPAKFDSSTAAQLSASGSWVVAGWRSDSCVGAAAIIPPSKALALTLPAKPPRISNHLRGRR